MEVPTATTLQEMYPEDAVAMQRKRWGDLVSKFKEMYGRPAEFVARSPGRVNLIGEHIDYSLYEVLPMAVTADVIIAVAINPASESRPSRVRIANVQSTKFAAREFEIPVDGLVTIDPTTLEWSNYFKAGLRGVSELLAKRNPGFRAVGMDILLDGTVPAGGGMSSSSAFVCSSALASMIANGEKTVDKKELVELAIKSERSVGVNGGGMDQSASVFSQRGSALYVSFTPTLQVTPIEFPTTDPEFSFVVAQTFVAADKHITAPIYYNLRVVECTLAAAFLSKIFGIQKDLPRDFSPLGVSIRGFHDAFFEEKEGIKDNSQTSISDFQEQLKKLHKLTDDYLPQEEGYTREQIADVLGVSVEELNKQFMSRFPVRAERFKLRQRVLHVLSEAQRVILFRQLLLTSPLAEKEVGGGGGGGSEALLKSLGQLMNETQDSCRDVYECSCPELDELCQLARGAGAYGSRLTGAGWGGCSVHLVPKNKIESVKQAWENMYYRKRWPDIAEERLVEAIVVSKPGSGSYLFKVTGDQIM